MPRIPPDPETLSEADERLSLRGVAMSRMVAQNHAAVAAARAASAKRRLQRAQSAGADAEKVSSLKEAARRDSLVAKRSAQHEALCRRREEVFLLPNPKVAAFGRVEDTQGRPLQDVPVQIRYGDTLLAEEKTTADGTFAVYYVPSKSVQDRPTHGLTEMVDRAAPFSLRIGSGRSAVDRELSGVGKRIYQAACVVRLHQRSVVHLPDAPAAPVVAIPNRPNNG